MLEGEPQARAGAFAPLIRRLEAEQERWFLWVPVFLGLGIGLYFALPFEPHILTALAPLAVTLALVPAAPRRMGVTLALTALTAAAVGFALAKLRVEWVRAPVAGKTDILGRAARARRARRAEGDARAARHPAGDVDVRAARRARLHLDRGRARRERGPRLL